MDGHVQFAAIVIHMVVCEHVDHAAYFVQYLLEPKLVRLVDHDEEHFVVRLHAVLVALRGLGAQDLVQLQVIGIVDVGHCVRWLKVGGQM